MKGALPVLECPRVKFESLTANLAVGAWEGVEGRLLREAVTGEPPLQDTVVLCAHDQREWRVLFHCYDRDAWATLTEHDAPLYTEETVEIFFDPVGDLESYYEIEVNPLGTVLDLVFRRSRSGYKGDSAWNCEGLRVAVRREPGVWAAEIAIPIAVVANAPPAEWRVNFCRIDRPSRDNSIPRELSAWSPPMRANFHTPERFGVVRFL
jgi:hypothetical protein